MNRRNSGYWILNYLLIAILISSCAETKKQKLPYIGFHDINGSDTSFYKIPSFNFFNQDSVEINNEKLSNSIYVADFFYTYCPTICPIVKNQMLRIHDKFQDENSFKLVSFALDPKRDNIEHLNLYSNNLGVNSKKWHFLTGDRDEIWDLAEKYLISVKEDTEEPGGIYHSGKIILIDTEGHIRGFIEGTNEDEVTKFMKDIKLLLDETKIKEKLQ